MFKENQLLVLDSINAEEVSDIQLDGINYSSWQRSPNGLLLVPEEYRPEILRQYHDSKIAGHWGHQRMQELVSRDFTWDGWREQVTQYITLCQKYQRSK